MLIRVLARKFNSISILEQLRLHAPLSRASLAKSTGLTRSSISRIVDQLISGNLIREIGAQQDSVGRPGTLMELNPAGGSAIGIELGVDKVSVIQTDFVAQILWRKDIRLPDEAELHAYLNVAEELIEEAIQNSNAQGLQLFGIGVGVWGVVDVLKGEVRYAPNLKWRNVPLKQLWEDKFGLTVFVDNEANAAAMGEYYLGQAGRAKYMKDFIYLSTGIGLGGGVVNSGQVFRGWNGYAGEVGHMTIDRNGENCQCGKKGCWETLVGTRVAIRRYQERTGKLLPFDDLVALLHAKDPLSLEIFTEMAMALGLGIGNLVNVLNPRCIVIGGELESTFDIILPIINDTFSKNCLSVSQENTHIFPSDLGSDACVLGCVALILDEVIRQRTW